MNYMMMPLRRYADFEGRSRRKEYWSWALLNFLTVGVLSIILAAMFLSTAFRSGVSVRSYAYDGYGSYSYPGTADFVRFLQEFGTTGWVLMGLISLWSLVTFIPNLAVGIRRLHDTDRSGWTLFLGLIPLIGPIILLVFMLSEGTRGPNRFGPDPKQPYGHHGGYYGGYPGQHHAGHWQPEDHFHGAQGPGHHPAPSFGEAPYGAPPNPSHYGGDPGGPYRR